MPILVERERGNMRKYISGFKFFFAGAVCILLFFIANPIRAMADELYFDDEGNLYYVTRDKKASGNVKYLTIGWIIKRYDAPIDLPGQQYVIVTKENYKPDEPDPNDSRYVYSYFKSDKNEILGAVESVSREWYDILVNYGDTVYIDSVMTVVNKGNQLGYLYPGGTYTGEVYFTYDGIANAREWASTAGIRLNFDMATTFLATVHKKDPVYDVVQSEKVEINSAVCSIFDNGSDKYDISAGIPSGESIYVKGYADKQRYTLICKKVKVDCYVDVIVPVTYVLSWVDYKGVRREEKKQIDYLYTVKRTFDYFAYDSIKSYMLKEVVLKSDVLKGNYVISVDATDGGDIMSGTVCYGDAKDHVVWCDIGSTGNVATIPVEGTGYLKPDIPAADYSNIAESLVGDVRVRSDRIVVGGRQIVSDEVKDKTGASPTGVITSNTTYVGDENIKTYSNVFNGNYGMEVSLVYKSQNGETYTCKGSELNNINIHTPVVCHGNAGAAKDFNQAVEPSSKDIVLGEKFNISFNDYGTHRSIKGYGTRSYAKYVGKRQVIFPFDVIYKNVRYKSGSCITLTSFREEFILCDDNEEGDYQIELITYAYNNDSSSHEVVQEKANTDITKYGATNKISVRVIGKIYDLQIDDGEMSVKADKMPISAGIIDGGVDELDINSEFLLRISTLGDIGDNDSLHVRYRYFHERSDGNVEPVEVYEVQKRDQISYETLRCFIKEDIWYREKCMINGNKGEWTGTYNIPKEFIVVPVGTTADDIKKAVREDKINAILVDGGSLIVAAEFVRYKGDKAYLDYINEKNSKNGYCNMWLYEGGSTEYGYGAVIKYGLAESDYYDYEVMGTH